MSSIGPMKPRIAPASGYAKVCRCSRPSHEQMHQQRENELYGVIRAMMARPDVFWWAEVALDMEIREEAHAKNRVPRNYGYWNQ